MAKREKSENKYENQILAFTTLNPSFKPEESSLKAEITVKLIIENDEAEQLLLKRIQPPTFWEYPGGRMKAGEKTFTQTAIREGFEETGVKLENISILGFNLIERRDGKPQIVVFEKASIIGEPKVNDPTEHDELGYFSKENLPNDVSRLVKAYCEGDYIHALDPDGQLSFFINSQ